MLSAAFLLPTFVGEKARVDPRADQAGGSYAKDGPGEQAQLDPARAAKIVKGFASRLGADLVGICRTDPLWSYSHRGEIHYNNWEEWGRELDPPLEYAVVVATAMDGEYVAAAPHTPTVVESSLGYAKGAYITTILAQWFGAMGYRAVAEHNRNYDSLMVPLAVEAGLGELGRQGYLIADKYGPGVRLFVCQTDMPLAPDRPLDLGAEKFCERCVKCAQSCPSGSIPTSREKTMERGLLRWKMDEESCFDYWGKVGTDCCICMAVCPFNRPDRPLHRMVRGILKRSHPAQVVFPHLDNLLYGRKWKPRKAPDWMDYG
jgi:reductive dehalogenase